MVSVWRGIGVARILYDQFVGGVLRYYLVSVMSRRAWISVHRLGRNEGIILYRVLGDLVKLTK